MSDHRTRWPLWGGIALAVAVVGVGSGLAGAAVGSSGSAPASGPAATTAAAGGCPVTPVADRVLPSVVTIAVQGPNGSGTGSGEIIRSGGYILTNNHVIAPAASGGSMEVKFSDGSTSKASLTGRDPQTDLAVIKAQSAGGLKPIAMGSSGPVRVGQPVIALGAPLGLSGTVTSGIVSALDRTVQVPGENDSHALLVSAVQTDAAINPGNSGGALVNCDSQLVGVPTAGASVPSSSGESSGGNIGLGFAIPVNLARTISDELISSGRVTHAYFGLQTVPVPAAAAQQSGTPEGLYVGGVTAGGPAAGAGLRAGDVITKIQGEDATSNIQLEELTLTKKAGDKVPLTYRRGGSTHTADVTLGSQP